MLIVRLQSVSGKTFYVRATRTSRPDVASAFQNQNYNNSGFNSITYLAEIPSGKYTIHLMQATDKNLLDCITDYGTLEIKE